MVSEPSPSARIRALPPGGRSRHNLTQQPTPLTGRDAELDAVCARLLRGEARLLTLTGPPGIGKTRLAIAAAERLLGEFLDGVWFVALEAIGDPALVPSVVARTLGLREVGGQPLRDALIEHLRGASVLLVLDNMEQLLDAAPGVADLLSHCPGLSILATSRAPLRLRWEQVFPVPPLALPDLAGGAGAAALSDAPAAALFLDRARAATGRSSWSDRDSAAIAAICARLDGLPLAIELAAARTRLYSPHAILGRLEERFELLAGGARDLPARQRSLRAALDWSYDLLGDAARAAFRRLGAFSGGCTLEAARAVVRPGAAESARDPASDPVPDLIGELVEHNLLRRGEEPDGEPRLRMLETVREYALERLAESGELDGARAAHADVFLALARAAEPSLTGPEQGAWLDRLEREHDNLRAALDWARATRRTDLVLELAGSLRLFWLRRGHLSEGRGWLERALGDGHAPAVPRAKALEGVALFAYHQGDYPAARARYEEILALTRETGNRGGVAGALNFLGAIAQRQGDLSASRAFYEESLAIGRELGNAPMVAALLNNLGTLAHLRAETAEARAHFEEALSLCRRGADPNGTAGALANLGRAAAADGEPDTARAYLEESLSIRRALGNASGVAGSLEGLAALDLRRGDAALARARHEEALVIRRRSGERGDLAASLAGLARAARAQGDRAAARGFAAEGLRLARELGLRAVVAALLDDVAALAASAGQAGPAARLRGAAEAARDRAGETLLPHDRAERERAVDALRATLGDRAFGAGWDAGRALPEDAAIAVALRLVEEPAEGDQPSATSAQSTPASPAIPPAGLTSREAQVLELLAEGRTTKQIADALVLSVSTVERHVANIYAKIGAHSRADAIAFAFRTGFRPA